MTLENALKGLKDSQEVLRNATAINTPTTISLQMMRMSQYAGIIDEYLAGIEQEYEIKLSTKILENTKDMKFTPAETKAKVELAEIKSQIAFLSRLSTSAWKQISVAQSRYNHIKQEASNNI